MNQRPTREQVERLRRQYPAGTRITLHSMDDPQAPPPGTKGTVAYVDDMGVGQRLRPVPHPRRGFLF